MGDNELKLKDMKNLDINFKKSNAFQPIGWRTTCPYCKTGIEERFGIIKMIEEGQIIHCKFCDKKFISGGYKI